MYWINHTVQYNPANQVQFFLDNDSDKSILPTSTTVGVQCGDDTISCQKCGLGSIAISIATGNFFVLNSSDQWVQIGG